MGCSSARGMGGLEQLQLTLESQQQDEDGSENASICLTGWILSLCVTQEPSVWYPYKLILTLHMDAEEEWTWWDGDEERCRCQI